MPRKHTGNYTASAYVRHPGRNPRHEPGGSNKLMLVRDGKAGEKIIRPIDHSRWLAHRGAKETGLSR